ncbi:hypothetical protein GEMRC1_007749 [Eukaryota sp. GEM-RC1]
MASRGVAETDRLKANIEAQLSRLFIQLEDLEELRAELDDEEYEITKADTIEQMKDFKKNLDRTVAGNLSLVDELGSIQLAMQAAISEAFKTPKVIQMFAAAQPGQLRQHLQNLTRDCKLNKLSKPHFIEQKLEILVALKKLGETLTEKEDGFISKHTNPNLQSFEGVGSGYASTQFRQQIASEIVDANDITS